MRKLQLKSAIVKNDSCKSNATSSSAKVKSADQSSPFLSPVFGCETEDATTRDEVLSLSSIVLPLSPMVSPESDQKLEDLEDFIFRKMFSKAVVCATVCKAFGLGVPYDTAVQLIKECIVDNGGDVGDAVDYWSQGAWEYAKSHDRRSVYSEEAQ